MVIVGLGNPGLQYERTRHNFGFMVIDAYAQKLHTKFRRTRFGLVAVFEGGWILKPVTYMNLSGDAVAPFCRFYRIKPSDIIVVADDLDLPLGTLRIRRSGSSGGHNGLKSIEAALATQQFARMRLGISRPKDSTIDWVLGRFSHDETATVQAMIERGVQALDCVLTEGIDKAMSQYNG